MTVHPKEAIPATYGLYIGNESRPVEVGEMHELRALVKHLTTQQRRDGWTIAPVDPWRGLSHAPTKRNPLWVGLGVLLLVTALVIVALTFAA